MKKMMFAILFSASAVFGSQATIHVQGMTCGACATAVKHVLSTVPGVQETRVSYQNGEAVVSYDPAKTTPDAIARAAEQKLPGYKFDPATASEHLSFYQIGLVCPAAPTIGCGGRSKPVLLLLKRDPRIKNAWLNEAGTRLAIAWKDSRPLSDEEINDIVSTFGLSVHEATDTTWGSERAWFDAANVDRLSEREAGIIAARLVRRLSARASLTPTQQTSLREGMARALRANFIDGDERDLDEQLVAAGAEAKLGKRAAASLREVVGLGIYPLPNER